MLKRRYELKIPIERSLKKEIVSACDDLLREDENGVDAKYRVSSLYFDTHDLASYRQKMDGERVRRKYRLRYYTRESGNQMSITSGYMEIKQRVNNVVMKERVRIREGMVSTILSEPSMLHDFSETINDTGTNPYSTIQKLSRAIRTPTFGPINVITYIREAWEGVGDKRFRLTFDTDCRVYDPAYFLDVCSGNGSLLMPQSCALMEVKFNDAIPRWFRDVINGFGLTVSRFSKYGAGVSEQMKTISSNK